MSFEDSNPGSTATIKLQKLSHIPSSGELAFALDQARKTPLAVIELPWKAATGPATYVLKVSCEENINEANWVLHRGETQDAAVLWSFDSDDLSLIESLIAAECDSTRDLEVVGDQALNSVPSAASPPQVQQAPSGFSTGNRPALPPGVPLDLANIQATGNLFKEQGTALTQEKFLLYFMMREFERFLADATPFALVLFRVRVDYGDGKIGFLPERAAQEAILRCSRVLRSIDMIGHYQENKYMVLLPGASANGGVQCVQALERAFGGEPLQPGLDAHQLRFSAGIASIPDTCDRLDVLIAAALDALKQSAEGSSSLVVFPSVSRAI